MSSYIPINKLPIAFNQENVENLGHKYSCIYVLRDYNSKIFEFSCQNLKPFFSGIPHPPHAHYYDKQWLKNVLQTNYKNDDESNCSLLKTIKDLEILIKDKFSKEYFTQIISSKLEAATIGTPMYEQDPGYWFWKCNFRPFETKEWTDLVESGVFNNLKVKISGLKNKVELNEKEGVIKGYKKDRFIVEIESKKYLLKQDNVIYNEDFLLGEQEHIFGRYIKKVTRREITYPTCISFRLSTPKDNWTTVYKNMCTCEFLERDDDVLRKMLQDYKFRVKFTPRIHYKIIKYRIFISVELLLLELVFYEKKPKKPEEEFIVVEDTEDESD